MFEFANASGGVESLLFANNGTSTNTSLRYTSGAYTVTNDQTGAITLSTWDYFGYLWNGSTLYTTKNGAQLGSGTTTSTDLTLAMSRIAYLGKSVWSGTDGLYSGKMDEFRVKKGIGANFFRTTDYNTNNDPNSFWSINQPVFFSFAQVRYNASTKVFWSTSS